MSTPEQRAAEQRARKAVATNPNPRQDPIVVLPLVTTPRPTTRARKARRRASYVSGYPYGPSGPPAGYMATHRRGR
jgi:hypothetical protein